MLQDTLRVQRPDVGVHPPEDRPLVLGPAEHRLGNHAAGDRGDAPGVGPVHVQPGVHQAAEAAVHHRRAGGQCRHDGQHQADGGVQAPELVVAGEGEVQVYRLEVGPAVSPAVEDAVIGLVDGAVLVGPEAHLGGRVHPGVHSGGHEPPAPRRKQRVDPPHVLLERGRQRVERRRRPVGLHLHHVQHQLVGPGDRAQLDLGRVASGHGVKQLVGDGQDGQAPGGDDHVFQLDAEAFEQVQGARISHRGLSGPCGVRSAAAGRSRSGGRAPA